MDIPNKFCHNCGTKLPATSKFCSSCGTSLASIDEKPPVVQKQVLGKPKRETTFTPALVGGEYEPDEIRADRAESLADLGISLAELDVQISVEGVIREPIDNVVRAGAALPQGYKVQPRNGLYTDVKATMEQIRLEGSATKASTEIK